MKTNSQNPSQHPIFNSVHHYGWVSILLHWSMALALIATCFLGDYMVELEYYDTWYHKAPALHKAVGATLAMVLVFRILWNFLQAKPVPLEENTRLKQLAKLGQKALYGLIIIMVISGYLISTAKGKGVDVFGLFELPALLADDADRGELAGEIHEIIATVFISLVVIHVLAALLHHFVFKDRTLKRMLWVKRVR